jgi:GxxExxY protein
MTTFTAEGTERAESMKNFDKLTEAIIGPAMEVHRSLGPGLLESTYETCLCRELSIRGIPFERQVPIPMEYKGVKLDCGYRADIIVDRTILLEIKAIDSLLPIQIGLLINFNVELLKHGLHRRVLGLAEEAIL